MTRYLLDTHVWFWSLVEPDRLSSKVAMVLEHPDSILCLSPLSIWEILELERKKRVFLGPDPLGWIGRALDREPMREVPLSGTIVRYAHTLSRPPLEPVDRFLVATAAVNDLCLVTNDREILATGGCRMLSNRD